MPEDQKVDAQLGNQLGQHVDRLADDQVIDDVDPLGGQQSVRGLQVRLHMLALVRERDLGYVLAGKQVRRGVVDDGGKMHFDRGVGRDPHRFVECQTRLRSAVIGDENLAVHDALLAQDRVIVVRPMPADRPGG